MDAAIAVLRADVGHVPASYVGRVLEGVLPSAALPGTPVWKVGRTSRVTTGKVTAFALDNLRVSYRAVDLEFEDQMEVIGDGGAFSRPGDSGSLVLDGSNRAAGLLFAGAEWGGAGGKGVSYVNPIGAVLSQLGVRLQMADADADD